MKKLILLNIMLCSTQIFGNITERDDWNIFAVNAGIAFLQSQYHAHLHCEDLQNEEYLCKVSSKQFEVNYHINIKDEHNHSYINIMEAPKVIHFATTRLQRCPSYTKHTAEENANHSNPNTQQALSPTYSTSEDPE